MNGRNFHAVLIVVGILVTASGCLVGKDPLLPMPADAKNTGNSDANVQTNDVDDSTYVDSGGTNVDDTGSLDGADGSDGQDGLDDSGALDLTGDGIGWPGWDNATVYFVIIDRFHDGNPANNNSYGRVADGEDEVGTFHGGDLAGLTDKLNEGFFSRLGVSAIWITAPYEQIHGWVVGGGGGFKHYAYHGYYPLDWTQLDDNYGTEDEFETFVDTAHALGIRVILDVVMNHAGYATAKDLTDFDIDVVLEGWESATVDEYYDYIDFDSENFRDWWGPQWVRADLGGNYSSPGTDLLTQSVSFLPDFKTESPVTNVKIPKFFENKPDTAVVQFDGYRVRDYLITWLVAWVENYGIDGFRCDTAKHVDMEAWGELSAAANAALRNWRLNNPDKAFPDSEYADVENPFWMTGEVFPHGVVKDDYYTIGGFDSLINFEFQKAVDDVLADIPAIDALYAEYASAINSDSDFNVLTYISSHDTSMFFDKEAKGDFGLQKLGGTLLLLCPGAVQIFYGDENAREKGPGGGDATQGLRSDYQFGANPGVFSHWQRLGLFRKRHPAVGSGAHQQVLESPYAFRRATDNDVVYVAVGAVGAVTLNVEQDWEDGATIRDGYTGATAVVASGQVTFTVADEGVLLLERSVE